MHSSTDAATSTISEVVALSAIIKIYRLRRGVWVAEVTCWIIAVRVIPTFLIPVNGPGEDYLV
jgi:hypothetical protein